MKKSVDKEWATLRCTPLVTRQVKRQPYLFSCFLRCFTLRGSKKCTPTFENAGATCRRSAGSPAIKGGSGVTLLLLQYEHRCRIFLTAAQQHRIDYCRLNSFWTCSTPSCLSLSWQSITMRWLSSLSGDNTMGCRLENGIPALLIRPPTQTISSPLRKEERKASLLLQSLEGTFSLGQCQSRTFEHAPTPPQAMDHFDSQSFNICSCRQIGRSRQLL